MPRIMTPAMLAALTGTAFKPALFVQDTFADHTVYVWSGRGSITWNGHTWIGVGTFGGLSTIEEGTTVEAKGITQTLSGIDPAMLAEALQEMQLGAAAIVYLGCLDGGGAVIADPIIVWSGRMDQPMFEIGGLSASLSINCESRLIDMNTAVDRRHTFDDAQIDNPGDLGFMFVNSIQEQTFVWGSSSSSSNNV